VTDRIVIVTGSAGGIGSAIVRAFETKGDTVIGLDLVDGFDIRDPGACQAAADEIKEEYGRIDVLCGNAGVGAVGDILAATVDDWTRVFDVNVFGLAHLTGAVIPVMRRQGSGAIVNTCSIAAEVGLVERVVYSASKGAVLAMTRAIAADEVRYGIRVNCVCPGTVDGPWVRRLIDNSDDPAATLAALAARQPTWRLITAEEVAAAVIYLADPSTATTGHSLQIDGGLAAVRVIDSREQDKID